MRILHSACLLVALGCADVATDSPAKLPPSPAPSPVATVPTSTCAPADEEMVKSGPDAPLPPDLGTRKAGSDWPQFLGPTGDSVSTEKGIVTPWPKDGPPL